MTWKASAPILWCVLLPVLAAAAYFTLRGGSLGRFLVSENGIVEIATAALFLAAALFAFGSVRARPPSRPAWFGFFFALYGGAALFVCLEELSYGQHLLGWESPSWFHEHNVQEEMNLHNLFVSEEITGKTLARRMRGFAFWIFPLFTVLLPLAAGAHRREYSEGGPGFWLLPRLEAAVAALMPLALLVPNAIAKTGDVSWNTSDVRELQELYWAWAAALWASSVRRRVQRLARA